MSELPDAVELRPTEGQRWTYPGGEEDEHGVTLFIGASVEDGPSRGYEVRIPLDVDPDGTLHVGEPEVTEVER